MKISHLLIAFASLSLLIVGTGCYSTADGHMRAGVPLAKDRLVTRYDRGVNQVLNAAREVLKRNGQIQTDDSAGSALYAKVNQRNVWIKVSEVDEKVSEVTVQARTRMGTADIDLASKLNNEIGIQLAVSP